MNDDYIEENESVIENKNELDSELIEKEIRYSGYQSIWHFCLLCFLSFGLYLFFWFYKHWLFLKDEKKLKINLMWRALFTLFYGYSLFNKFHILAKNYGYRKPKTFILFFTLFIICFILGRINVPYLIFISFFSFLLLIPMLKMLNFYYLKEQKDFKIKKRLAKDEIFFLLILWGCLILNILII